jgi:hypothetical protein
MVKDNRTLGRFLLNGLPPAPRGVPRIEVTFDIDSNGLVNVSAKDMATQKETRIQITSVGGLTKDEVESMVIEAEEHEADDRRRRDTVETRNRGEQLVYQAASFLETSAERLTDAVAQGIRTAMAGVQEVLRVKDTEYEILTSAVEQLQADLYAAGEAMYRPAGSAAAASSSSSSSSASAAPRASSTRAPPPPLPKANGAARSAPAGAPSRAPRAPAKSAPASRTNGSARTMPPPPPPVSSPPSMPSGPGTEPTTNPPGTSSPGGDVADPEWPRLIDR